MESCWTSYGNFVAGMVTYGLLAAVWQEMKNHKQELERTRNQWKVFSISPARRHPDVMDNNSIPAGP